MPSHTPNRAIPLRFFYSSHSQPDSLSHTHTPSVIQHLHVHVYMYLLTLLCNSSSFSSSSPPPPLPLLPLPVPSTFSLSTQVADKISSAMPRICEKLGQYHMPFAWAVRPLFSGWEQLDTTSEFSPLFRQDRERMSNEDLLRMLAEYKK